MKEFASIVFLMIAITAGAAATAAERTGYEGKSCPRLSKPLDCMVCVLYFEARPSSYAGMVAVGRVVMERTESRHYPDSICSVIYQDSQFVALPTSRKMSNDPDVMRLVVKAAKDAIAAGGNGFLGFRTCSSGANHVAGNCFRKTGELFEDLIPQEFIDMGVIARTASVPYDDPGENYPSYAVQTFLNAEIVPVSLKEKQADRQLIRTLRGI